MNLPFTLKLIPNTNIDGRFFATPSSSINITINTNLPAYFYTTNIINLGKAVKYSGIAIVVLAWIAYFVAVKSRKLAGL